MGAVNIKKEDKEDTVHRFWREYDEADMLERDKKIKPIVKSFIEAVDALESQPDIREHAVNTQLRSYFDDLLEYTYDRDKEKKV